MRRELSAALAIKAPPFEYTFCVSIGARKTSCRYVLCLLVTTAPLLSKQSVWHLHHLNRIESTLWRKHESRLRRTVSTCYYAPRRCSRSRHSGEGASRLNRPFA